MKTLTESSCPNPWINGEIDVNFYVYEYGVWKFPAGANPHSLFEKQHLFRIENAGPNPNGFQLELISDNLDLLSLELLKPQFFLEESRSVAAVAMRQSQSKLLNLPNWPLWIIRVKLQSPGILSQNIDYQLKLNGVPLCLEPLNPNPN